MDNVVIENFETDHGKNIGNGFAFNMSLKIIKQAYSMEIHTTGNDKASQTDGKKQKAPSKTQTQKTKSKGKIVNKTKTVDKQAYDSYTDKLKRQI